MQLLSLEKLTSQWQDSPMLGSRQRQRFVFPVVLGQVCESLEEPKVEQTVCWCEGDPA